MPSGHRDLDGRQQVLEDLVTGLDALLLLLGGGGLLGDVGPQLLEGVELRGELGEVVVELGELADLDRADGHGAVGVGALLVATGERGHEVLGLARGHAEQCLVHALEHRRGADLVGHAGHRVDLLATDLGPQVDRDEVAVLDRPVDADEGAEALAQRGEPLLDVLLARLDRVDGDGDAVRLGELDVGTNVGLDGELEVLAVLERHGRHVDLGLADRADALAVDGLAEEAGQGGVDGLLDDGAAADALVDDPGGHVALAEAGDLDLSTDGLVGRVEVGLELVERHLDVELDPGRAEGLDGTLHFRHSELAVGSVWVALAPCGRIGLGRDRPAYRHGCRARPWA